MPESGRDCVLVEAVVVLVEKYVGLRSHIETLMIYKLGSKKFTKQNDLCE